MAPATITETHTAVVVAFEDRVFKIKKPVRFPFVDLSTGERRRRICEREVELNKRLATDVYLGVATLTGAGCDEPVVVMRRMPDDARLATLVSAGREPASDCVRSVARAVAAFHASARRSTAIAEAGSAVTVLANALRNIDELRTLRILDDRLVLQARAMTEAYVAGRKPLFAKRIADSQVADGHGDLLADDIFCLPDGPRILDCLEFDDALRYGDVLSDAAFLAMDLERLGGEAIARAFMDEYAEFSGSTWPPSLEHFYVAQRALVRSKVSCIRAIQGQREHLEQAEDLLHLALRHLEAGRCRLVLIGGVPGMGKTTVARGLADVFAIPLLQSDVTRKQIYGIPAHARHPEAFRKGLYDAQHTRATYAELLRQASISLTHGFSVVIDATWLNPAARRRAAGVAAGTSSDFVQLRCVTPSAVAHQRIIDRASTADDISDATPQVAARMEAEARPWSEATIIDTTQPPAAAIARAAEFVVMPVVGRDLARRDASASPEQTTITGRGGRPTLAVPSRRDTGGQS